jgi:citrate synthase
LLGLVEAAAAEGIVAGGYVAIGREVEAALRRRTGKSLPMNIDGATAVIFAELGFAPEMGRGLFILSRSVGILAHAWEQIKAGRRMKGPMPKDIPFTYAGPERRKLDRSA